MSGPDPQLNFDARLADARSKLALDPASALAVAEELLDSRSDPRLANIIAEAHHRLGNLREADHAYGFIIRASAREPQLRQANAALEERRWEQAEALATAYLEDRDQDPVALTILGEALVGMHRAVEAEAALRPIVTRAPSYVRAQLALAQALEQQCRMKEAVAIAQDLVGRNADSLQAWRLLARLLMSSRQFDRAIEAHEKAVELDRANPESLLGLAQALRFAGRTSDAIQALRRSIEADPGFGPGWSTLATIAPAELSSDDAATIEQALKQTRDPDQQSHFHVAKAMLLERSQDYESAFRHYSTGKAIRKRMSAYEPARLVADNDANIALLESGFPGERGDWKTPDRSPVFILGMPRSGSTLVERILARHSQIEATGELPILFRLVDQIIASPAALGGYRALLPKMPQSEAEQWGDKYIALSKEFRATDKPLFTDKLHLNWLHLPLIRLILPTARIIDVRRDALDCCWSNFKTIFAEGHPASDDLTDIAGLYREYARLMDTAANTSDEAILTVRYEDVVEDVQGQTRRILDFLGLAFEPACLEFHRLEMPVATISAEQVRKPLNREGIDRWRPYRQWLGPLIEALGPLATTKA